MADAVDSSVPSIGAQIPESDAVNLPTPYNKEYVFFLHGVLGRGSDFDEMCRIYRSYDENAILLPVINFQKDFSLGIHHCALKVIEFMFAHMPCNARLSIVCHSFGGLIGRHVVYLLRKDFRDYWESLDKRNFWTFATPHLGVQESTLYGFAKLTAPLLCGRSGRELTYSTAKSESLTAFDSDDDPNLLSHLLNNWYHSISLMSGEGSGEQDELDAAHERYRSFVENHILMEIASDAHLDGMLEFKYRAMINNTSNDNIVGKLTGLGLEKPSSALSTAWDLSKQNVQRLIWVERTPRERRPSLLELSTANRLQWLSDRVRSLSWDCFVVYHTLPMIAHNLIFANSRVDLTGRGKQSLKELMSWTCIGRGGRDMDLEEVQRLQFAASLAQQQKEQEAAAQQQQVAAESDDACSKEGTEEKKTEHADGLSFSQHPALLPDFPSPCHNHRVSIGHVVSNQVPDEEKVRTDEPMDGEREFAGDPQPAVQVSDFEVSDFVPRELQEEELESPSVPVMEPVVLLLAEEQVPDEVHIAGRDQEASDEVNEEKSETVQPAVIVMHDDGKFSNEEQQMDELSSQTMEMTQKEASALAQEEVDEDDFVDLAELQKDESISLPIDHSNVPSHGEEFSPPTNPVEEVQAPDASCQQVEEELDTRKADDVPTEDQTDEITQEEGGENRSSTEAV
eukprot:GDKJ01059351.1.p1 GENE.GDKJ01059351.1~~GDKJ01059351.1.p1  ORF type:complete len:681 (-),score=172.35 GDKJ01059351.1:236-2278(-)